MLNVLYAVFVLSGAAGLIYESIWTRYLGLFVGHSAYAQMLVLVIFLGGMSLGALAVGKRSERLRAPLLWYAAAELACGLVGLVFHRAFLLVTDAAYDHLFPVIGSGVAHSIAKWTIAGLLILPQSVLLGATFPLMSAGVVRRVGERSGRALSMLYFTNSLGAAVGVLVAGFVLLQAFGLPGTLLTAAVLNICVAAVVWLSAGARERGSAEGISAGARERGSAGGTTSEPPALSTSRAPALQRALLIVSFGTALASFVYEIGWIRMLSLVLGSATHSFELMLSAFILGLALGAFWVRRRADEGGGSLRLLGVVQIVMGSLAIATLPVYLASFHWMASLMAAFAKTTQGYQLFSISRYAICLAVMLPATFCAGMTLPLITRSLIGRGAGERAIGQVYGINTLGSIAGAALAGIVLMPLLGLKWMLVVGAAVDFSLGVALLVLHRRAETSEPAAPVWSVLLAPAGVAAVLAFIIAGARFDTSVLTSAVYRYGTVAHPSKNIAFYRDGRTATVSVRRVPSTGALSLATNGKPDASLGAEWFRPHHAGDPRTPFAYNASTQYLLSLLTLAHAPRARDAAVIGQGSGMSSHALLGSPYLEHLVTIEIEPQMIEASRMFMPANRRVFEDPRSEIAIDDARSYFATQRRAFDLIMSEPSNPWVSGVSGLFTTEFYGRVKRYLSPTGVFGQWLHLTEINDDLVASVVAALAQHFPAYAMYAVSDHDVIIVATLRDSLPSPDWSVFEYPAVEADLARVLPITIPTLDALRLADHRALAPLVRTGVVPNSDFHPVLDLGAERARYLESAADGFFNLAADRFSPALVGSHWRHGLDADPYAVVVGVPRLAAAEVSARVRHGVTADASPDVMRSLERMQTLDRLLASNAPPTEWHLWVQSVAAAEQTLHGGAAGIADTAFYARLHAYLARTRAPREVRAAVDFLEGLAAWDFAKASEAANPLVIAAARGDLWLDPDMLRDGAVVAKLQSGDVEAARAALRVLAPLSRRPASDLRSRLLVAYVVTAGVTDPTVPKLQRVAEK